MKTIIITVATIFSSVFLPIQAHAITKSEVFNLVNKQRIEAGIPALKSNVLLDKAAQGHLDDMLKNNYFAHNSPSGVKFYKWIDNTGYNATYEGENLAIDFLDATSTVKAWMDSPTHKANIVNKRYTETGIAISGSLIVQMFASHP